MDAVGLEWDDECWVCLSSLLDFIYFVWGGGCADLWWDVCRCGAVDCDGVSGGNATGWYLVCEYYPPGNVEGEYAQNVGKVKYQLVSGSGDAAKAADRLLNAAQGRWTGMKLWTWGIVGVVVVLGLVV